MENKIKTQGPLRDRQTENLEIIPIAMRRKVRKILVY